MYDIQNIDDRKYLNFYFRDYIAEHIYVLGLRYDQGCAS